MKNMFTFSVFLKVLSKKNEFLFYYNLIGK